MSADTASQAHQPLVNPWIVAMAVMLSTFMEVLDTTVVNVSLPHIAGSVSATVDEATWVLTSYLVANAIILPMAGWLARQFGRKRLLLASTIGFTIASALCGFAPNLPTLIVFRILQGLCGGALQPLSQAILLESFPPDKRGMAMAVFALGVVVAPVLGPTLGGYLTDAYSWRWAFYINIPIGIFAIFMILRYIQDPPYIKNAKPGRIDGIGLGLLAVWLGALQIILDKGQEDDWFGANWICWATGILVVGFVAFIVRELTHDKPLVNLRVFRHRNFLLGCLLIAIFGGLLYDLVTLLPLFYQELLGYTAFAAGWAVSPRGIGAILAMPIIGVLTNKLDTRWLIACGFVMFGISSLRFGQADLAISQWSFFWAILLSGFGSGSIFVPLSTTTVAGLANEEIGNASGLYNLSRNIGGSIGISIVNTIVVRHQQLHQNELVHSITSTSVPLQNQLQSLQHYLQTQGYSAAESMRKAYALIGEIVSGQARLWSYVDDFRYMALVSFACIPIVFVLKKASLPKGAQSIGH